MPGEGVTNRAASKPFGAIYLNVVTKRASDLSGFVTLVTKCAGVTKRVAKRASTPDVL